MSSSASTSVTLGNDSRNVFCRRARSASAAGPRAAATNMCGADSRVSGRNRMSNLVSHESWRVRRSSLRRLVTVASMRRPPTSNVIVSPTSTIM